MYPAAAASGWMGDFQSAVAPGQIRQKVQEFDLSVQEVCMREIKSSTWILHSYYKFRNINLFQTATSATIDTATASPAPSSCHSSSSFRYRAMRVYACSTYLMDCHSSSCTVWSAYMMLFRRGLDCSSTRNHMSICLVHVSQPWGWDLRNIKACMYIWFSNKASPLPRSSKVEIQY